MPETKKTCGNCCWFNEFEEQNKSFYEADGRCVDRDIDVNKTRKAHNECNWKECD